MKLRTYQLSVSFAVGLALAPAMHPAEAMVKRAELFQKKKLKSPLASAAPKKTLAEAVAPSDLIAARGQKIVADLMGRPLRLNQGASSGNEVVSETSKAAWLQSVYSTNMVESSWATEMLSDKRLFAEVLKREMGARAETFYPKTLGLREFLVTRHLVSSKGDITATGDQIEEALSAEFPSGFLVRPAVGIAPQETGRGLYPDTDQFIVELLRPASPLYAPNHLRRPVRSHILDAVASGEGVVLQENFIIAADAKAKLKKRFFQEVRVHTYEARVVEDAVPARWVQTNVLSKDQVQKAEEFVALFLKSLPVAFTTRQAWGVDVAVMDNGQMRVIDVVTNRGKPIAWSSYLDQPRVIAAYTHHFEEFYGLHFGGFSGALIRHGFANYMPFWEKRIENAKPGLGKMTAYLPPVP